nr:hypothetical protein [Paracoccus sp. JM45]
MRTGGAIRACFVPGGDGIKDMLMLLAKDAHASGRPVLEQRFRLPAQSTDQVENFRKQ